MTIRKIAPRCSCVCRDGTVCGRRVTDGSQPPVCHVHKLQAQGGATSSLIPDEVDEIKILKRLARDSNPQVRLRAVDLLLDLKKAQRAEVAPSQADEVARFMDVLTEDETARLDALLDQIRRLKEEVWARLPELRPITARQPSR